MSRQKTIIPSFLFTGYRNCSIQMKQKNLYLTSIFATYVFVFQQWAKGWRVTHMSASFVNKFSVEGV